MKKLISDKDTSFDMAKVREEESDSKNLKMTQDVRGKPQERDKKPWFEQEWNVIALLSLVLCGEKRYLLCNKGVLL